MNKFYQFVRFAVLLAVLSLGAQLQAAQIFLKVSAPYSNDNPTWKVWTWQEGQSGYYVDGTVLSNGLIEFTVNESSFEFHRMSSDGNTQWNKSEVLTTVADATYEITGWGDGNGMTASVTNPTYKTVYLDPSAVTESGNVWYAWSFVTGGNGSWVEGTQSGDKYTFNVASLKDKIIFVRMNANGAPSWNSGIMLNQTNDLTVREGGTYVISSLGTNKMEGYWKSESSNGKGIWHQDPNGDPNYYLSNRRALTGRHCMINKLVNVVEAGSWINNLDNIVNENIEDVAEFPSIATAGVGVKPITSIRDTENHYDAGTTVGFNLVAASGSLLNLDLASVYSIAFFLEGELQQTVAVTSGQSVNGIGLSLINIPSSDDASFDVKAVAPCEFDEIALMPAGVNVTAITSTKVKYAFVGDYTFNTITQTSMQDYATKHGRLPFTLDAYPAGSGGAKIIDDDLTNGWSWGVVSIGVSMDAKAIAKFDRNDPDQSQCFKKGSTVGFLFSNTSVLRLPVGDGIILRLYKGEWQEKTNLFGNPTGEYEWVETEVQNVNVGGSILDLSVISGGDQFVSVVAQDDFSTVRFTTPTGLTLDLGFLKVKYAYISDPTDVNHECDLKLSANASICSKDTEYQLSSNDDISVTWSIESQPSGANASIDANGKITGMTVDGDYVVKATATDGCFDYVTITRGLFTSSATCDQPIVNNGETATYVLSENVNDGGSLININGNLQDPENVLNQSLEDYAMYSSVLNATVVENLPIVGVKKANGTFSDGNAHRIGFIVEAKSTGLTADVIDLFNIRTYKNGVQTASKVIKETNSVKVKLIGSNKEQKLRFAVDIPADVEFDEFILWKSGVLDLSIDRFKIYYAFDEAITDEDEPTECFDPLGCDATVISNLNNARIDGNNLQFAGGVQVGTVIDNLTFLVDDDITSGVSISNSVSLGDGLVLAIDLGHVYSANQQVGIIMDSKTYLAGIEAGSWVTIKTWLNGNEQESQSDWSVLGVNAIGYGDNSYIFMNPTKPYDAITITIASIANLLNFDSKYYGIFVRNDYDQDGTPDCKDDDSCMEEYTLDEEATTLAKTQDYPNGNLALHRSFDLENWNCIILPVDLTWEQVRNAFGNEVEIATPSGFYYTPILQTGSKATVLYYDPRTENADDSIAIHKNQYYIIRPFRDADITTGTYTAKDGETLNAPVYLIPGVTYLREDERPNGVATMTVNYKELSTGTSQNAPRIKEETTENIILHGSQVYLDGEVNEKVAAGDNYLYGDNNTLTRVTNDATMLGFRFYAENNTPNNVIHEEDWDTPTGIVDIFNDTTLKRNGVYTLDGRMIRVDNDITSLPAGIYIVGGKKVVIGTK